MTPVSERRKNQRGFALLVIFLMAAAIALMLYIQLPRVAFETEREKEQLLIDRGEQYKRAIQLFYTAYQRYPSKMEDLESTNDKRYLRHRYKDPYTGKEEWRLIHINGGVLTDSLVQKAPLPGNGTPGSSGSSTQLAGSTSSPTTPPAGNVASTTDPNAPVAVNQAVLQRPSDRTLPTNNSFNQTASNQAANPFPGAVPGMMNANGQTPAYNDPSTYPPMSLYPNGYNAPPAGQQGFNQPGFNPGLNQPGFNQPGFNQPGFNQTGLGQPGLNQPGLNQPGLNQPGASNPFGINPGLNPTGVNQPGLNQQGLNQPGLNQPGLNQPGGANPFGINQNQPLPGSNLQAGIQPGGFQQDFSQTGQQPPVQQIPGQSPGGLPGGFIPGVTTPTGINPNFPNQFPDPNNPGAAQQQLQQFQQVQQQTFLPNPNAGLPPAFNPGTPSTPGGGQPNQAINLINTLLTTPRQPPPGIGPTAAQPTTTGAGLAGVASTYKGPAIKSYGDRTEFQEWEFVFQPKLQQGTVGGPQAPGQNGQTGQSPQGAPPPTGMPSGAGGAPPLFPRP